MRRSSATNRHPGHAHHRRNRRITKMQRLESRQLLAAAASTPDFVVPTDADVIDVSNWSADASLNADPAAGNNDHAALQTLFDTIAEDPSQRTKIIYFPDGEYLVDQALIVPLLDGNDASARVVLQGENRDRVVIRLADQSALEDAVVRFQIRSAADAFRNAVRDLTIDVGAGNPDADGLRFVGSNQATVRNVHIRSSDPNHAGRVGLELGRVNRGGINEATSSGPLLIEDVSVDGFEIGIRTEHQVASQTFENISLSNQLTFGWKNETNQNVFARNVTSTNEVRAIQNAGGAGNGVFTLLDSQLVGVGDAVNDIAIFTEERLYARNVQTIGYAAAVDYQPSGEQFPRDAVLGGTLIEEYWSEGAQDSNTGGAVETFSGAPDATLGLPVEDSPETPLESDLSKWASPTSFVTVNPDGTPSGVPGDTFDDAAAVQSAIDSGATTIYLPNNGDWVIDDAVEIRGNVERLIGLESSLVTRSGDGVIRIGETTADTLVLERFESRRGQRVGFDHVSDQTIVARNLIGFDYRPVSDSPGDVFLYDVSLGTVTFRNQHVWARQLNPEGAADVTDPNLPDQKILNDNASVWILGMKVETEGTVVRTINGGQTELLGVYRNNASFSDANNPAFVTVDASLSVANFDSSTAASGAWAVHASETRDGITQTLDRIESTLYTAYSDATRWDLQQEVLIDNLDEEVSYVGGWSSSATKPGGYIGSDVAFSDDPNALASFHPDLPVAGQYDVFVRWIGESRRKSDHKGHSTTVPVQVTHAEGTQSLAVNQTVDGGRWIKIGSYNFDAGQTAEVEFGTNPGSNERKTIVDGVRFSLVNSDNPIPELEAAFPIQTQTRTVSDGIFAGGQYSFDADNGLLAGDFDRDGNELSVTAVRPGIGGEVTFAGDGSFSYAPRPWFTGWDVFEYTVSNGTQSTTGFAQILVADSFDSDTGELRRELTGAEQAELNSTVIETVRAESSNGGFPFRVLGTARNDAGIGGQPGHSRERGNDHYLGPANASPTFDLGGLYQLNTIRLWNFNVGQVDRITNRQTENGIRRLNVYVDTDTDGDAFGESFTLAQTIELPEAPGRSDYSGEVFDLGGVQARYVRIEAVSTHGQTASAGLSDLEFRGSLISPVEVDEVESIRVAEFSSERGNESSAQRTLGSGYFRGSNVVDSRSRSTNWESADNDPTPSITYDLGSVHELGSTRIWNYNYRFATSRGAKTVEVSTSIDNVSFEVLKNISLDIAPGSDDFTGQKFELDGVQARYLRLKVLESHGAEGNVGLAHVSVFGIGVSEAPTSIALDAATDTGVSDSDGITRRNNADAERVLKFEVFGTEPDDLITVFANDVPIGSAIATGSSTLVETDGITMLEDASYLITARRTKPGTRTSKSTPAISVEIDTAAPTATIGFPAGGLQVDTIDFVFDEIVEGFDRSDVQLRRNGLPMDLSAAQLGSEEATNFRLANLISATALASNYELAVDGAIGEVTDVAGNPVSIAQSFSTIPRIRSLNARSLNYSVIEHQDAFLLDSGAISFSFRADKRSGTLFSKDHLGFGDGGHLTIRIRNRKIEVRLQSGDESYYVRSGNIAERRDYQIEFQFGPDGMRLFRDGVLVDSNDYTGGLGTTSGGSGNVEDIVIGASKVRSDPGENNNLREFFSGRIRDVRIQNGSGDVLFSEAVVPYDLETGSNIFNGVDQFVEVAHSDAQELETGAFEVTFNTFDASQRQALFSKDNRGFDDGGHLTANLIDGRVEVRLQSDAASHYVSSEIIDSNRDYRLRFEFGAGGMNLFLDGELVGANDYDGGLQGNENPLVIAASQRRSTSAGTRLEDHFFGSLMDFRLLQADGQEINLFGLPTDDA
ncbi:MAG: glycosyl hydrolase family 28-related protein [Planctomycetota bacterium]